MNRNVEIKAEVSDLASIEKCAGDLADEGPVILEQEDVFFHCLHGRLKLRRSAGSTQAELIAYERPDAAGPKESCYAVHITRDPDGLQDVLSAVLGIRGVVRKRRTLYVIGQTRVHVDRVDGLGGFIELEVVLREGQVADEGAAIARELMHKLGIPENRLIRTAYMDLIEARGGA